ncbi:MAG TPA: accessory Sec system translocase SecA2 [Clostridiaceae bacterium]
MFKNILKNLGFKSKESEYDSYNIKVEEINRVSFNSLIEEDFASKSHEFKSTIDLGYSMDEVMIEAFALVKEAIKRTLGLIAYDEQLIAGIAMHEGKVIEMGTGEGKTLAAVFSAYLNALTGKGVNILTFNDYLAKRDALWMGPVYEMLGLTVGFVQDNMFRQDKQKAYECDITYVTAKVAGFDYLKDLLCYEKKELIQRAFNFVIVDEADSIIIDEARIPLVIAIGKSSGENGLSATIEAIRKLTYKIDYDKDEYEKNAFLTDKGLNKVEAILGYENLYGQGNNIILNEVNNALYAEVLLIKDKDYIIKDDKIQMIDEFTGRIAENRHWPDGIQGALEAKEGLEIQAKGRIMSQITLQNFILLYKKVAGMTGTALDSADEIREFYGLEVFVILPHMPSIREDFKDVVFTHKEAKYQALIKEITEVNATGQPILIGTSSVMESEYLAEGLDKAGVKCQVLNAKNDEIEASIIEEAGTLSAITVSTNMAGRGIDIKLGGTKEIDKDKLINLGGLYVIGTNRHESIRIDKQLRGRAGRQGDEGSSKFFISLEDDLIKKYGIDKIIPAAIRPEEQEEAILDPKIAVKVEQAQRIVQGDSSDMRRNLWEYSSIIENQRLQVHNRRMDILKDVEPFNILEDENPHLLNKLTETFGEVIVLEIEKQVTLYDMDEAWADYLEGVATIQEGIHLSMVGGKDPIREFQFQTAELFEQLQEDIKMKILKDFEDMDLTDEGLLKLKERIKPPSSTWTYMVKDNAILDRLSLLFKGINRIFGF